MQQNFTDPMPKAGETSGHTVTVRPRELLQGVLLSAAAYVLCSPLLFSVNPLPLSLVCAADHQLGWLLLGTLFGCWQQGDSSGWTIAATITAVLLRLLFRLLVANEGVSVANRIRRYAQQSKSFMRMLWRGENTRTGFAIKPLSFNDTISRKVLISLFCALIPSLGISILGGFVFYDLYGSIFYLLLTPPLTALFAHLELLGNKDTSSRKAAQNSGIGLVAYATLMACVCFCGRSLHFFGLSPVAVLAVWMCLDSTRRRGAGGGILWSLVCGLPYDLFIVPLLIGVCIVYAALKEMIGSFSLLIATLGGAVYLLLFAKDEALWTILPSFVVGISLFSVRWRLHGRPTASPKAETPAKNSTEDDADFARMIIAQANHAQTLRTISAISGAFSSLAETFRKAKAICDLPAEQTYGICEQAFAFHCAACSGKPSCLKLGKESYRAAIRTAGQRLMLLGEISENDAQSFPFRDCPNHQDLARHLNDRYAKTCYDTIRYDTGGMFAMNCDGISHLFRDVLHREREHSEKMHPALAEQIASYLRKQKIPFQKVIVYGQECLTSHILGLSPTMLTVSQQQFRSDLGKVFGAEVSKLHYEGGEEGGVTLHTLPEWEIHCRYRSLPVFATESKRRPPCGDTIRTFDGPDGMFYALLCDGMGHGQRAAITSNSCAVFLERTLRAGVSVPTALSLLNQYLLTRAKIPEHEISSTIDLFCFNRYTGQGELIKSGAAPSWLLRDGRQICLCSHTLPIGILQTIDAHVLPLEVQAGDHILMMSDGVYDGEPAGKGRDWLADLLSHELPTEQEQLLQQILEDAQKQSGTDDMSVVSIRIEKSKKSEKPD